MSHGGAPPGIGAAYDRWAFTYDTDLNATRDLASLALHDGATVPAGCHLLEVGCGTGRNTPWLASRAGRVVATLVLEHVSDLGVFFREAFRVLQAGGACFVCELHPYRQLAGGQAQFTCAETNERTLVPAFRHDVSEYLNSALEAGFMISSVREWSDPPREGPSQENPVPRLFSMSCRRE